MRSKTRALDVEDLAASAAGSPAFLRLRPCLAEPPAESPSTMKSSDSAGSFSWQSASLPGRPAISSAPLRRVRSRALRAASRARAASTILPADRTRFVRDALAGTLRNFCTDDVLPTAGLHFRTRPVFPWSATRSSGSGTFTDSTAIMTFAHVVARQGDLGLLGDAVLFDVVAQRAGQRGAETDQVGAAILLGDVVGEAEHRFLVGVGPLHGDVDDNAVLSSPLSRDN